MAENPVKYSDLLQPDDSITKAISQLEQLQKTYSDMLKKISDDAKTLETNLKKVSGATEQGQQKTKAAASEADKLRQQQDKLKQSQSNVGIEMAKLKQIQTEQNQLTRLEIKLNKSKEGSYNKLSAQYSLNKIRLNKMSAEQRNATTAGKQLEKETKKLYEEMNKMQKATGKHQLQVGNYERALTGLPGPMGGVVTGLKSMTMAAKAFIATPVGIILGAIAAAGATIAKVISVSKEFEAQMDKVQAVTGASATEMYHLNKNAKELGKTTTKTATEVGQLQEQFAKLGFSTQEILNATEATIALSEATDSDLAQSAKVAASTIRGFGMNAEETQRVVDVMAKSFSSSALDLSKFETAMATIAPVAKVNNVSLERSTAQLGTLADAGLDASTAGTSLRNIYLSLSAAGLSYNEAMDKINTAQDKSSVALELFGKRGATAALVLAENGEKVAKLTDELNGAEGAANNMAATVRDNLNGDVKALTSAWEGLFLSMDDGGGIITKISRWFVQGLTKILLAVSNFKRGFITEWNELIEQSTVFRVAITAIQSAFGVLTSFVKAQVGAIVGTFTGVGKIIKAALTGNFEEAQQGWDKIKDGFVNGFVEVKETAKDAATNIAAAYNGDNIEQMKMSVSDVTDLINENTEAIKHYADESEGAYADSEAAAETAAKQEEKRAKLLYDLMDAGQAKELAALETSYAEKRKLFEQYGLDVSKLEEWKQKQQETIRQKYADKEKTATEKANKEAYDAAVLAIDTQANLRDSEIDLMQKTEAEKTKLKLQAEKDRLKAILELNKAGNKQLSDEEIKIYENTIARIDQEIQTVSSGGNYDLYSLAGLNLDDDQKEAINTSTQFAIGQVQAFLQSKIEAAQAAVDAANTEKDAAQSKLDAEIEARNNGYASNVSMAQKELALAKKNQEKALKDQEKAQKAQAAIETLQQVGSLVTASAKIWAQLGFPWAIPAIALMFGSFAAAKLKAAQVSKSKTESYGEGTVELLEGGSHQSGNDIEFGTKKDGTKRRAEGGEFFAVLNKRSSRKYRRLFPDIVKSLNKGVFEKKYWGAFDMGGMSINMAGGNDLRSLESDVNAIRKQGEKQVIPDGKGGFIIKYKNLTTYVN